jgi:pantothenate kinase
MTAPRTGRFDLLPVVSEAVAKNGMREMKRLNRLHPEALLKEVAQNLDELEKRNEHLIPMVVGLATGIVDLDPPADKLTRRESEVLEIIMTYAFLMVLRALNEARREEQRGVKKEGG